MNSLITRVRTLEQVAWECVHQNAYWTYKDSKGSDVVANFSEVTMLQDGTPLLTGTAMDEYGWWHHRAVIDLTKVRDMRHGVYGERPKGNWPVDAPFSVGINFEWRRNVIRLTIPDDAARRLNEWKRKVWIEIPGVGDGYTPPARRGTWEHKALAYLHSVGSHLTDKNPFIQGESFASTKDEHGSGGDYSLLVSTFGVVTGPGSPATGFHFTG